ncbi:hypothetical protein Pelo_12849 [Pelomyxa schiedti]|nr:hypothetical protein Pelo_12849 [Pelomyxa schiedti]
MTEWARSAALVRQWAEEWVLSPLWDAVFELPFNETYTRDFLPIPQHFLIVSVSQTLGVLGHSWFRYSDDNETMCGCIGDNRVLVVAINRLPGCNELTKQHFVRDTTAPWNQECLPEPSLTQWEPVRFTKCNRKWIVGCNDGESVIFIHRVCSHTRGSIVPEFTPLGDDVIMLHETDEYSNTTVEFVDVRESFEKKELVVTSKFECGTKWPLFEIGITWMPDGSPCILQCDVLANPHGNITTYRLVDSSTKHTLIQEFLCKKVATLSKNLLFVISAQRKRPGHNFMLRHTGDLAHHPSLRVPCTWASGDWPTGLILSTSHNQSNNTGGGNEIRFSLHDGVTGFHICVFSLPLPTNVRFKAL